MCLQEQTAIQPIHGACYAGRENVLKLIVETYGVDATTPEKVCRTVYIYNIYYIILLYTINLQ